MSKIKDDPKLYAIYKEKVLTCKNQHDTDNLLVWLAKQFDEGISVPSYPSKSQSSRSKSSSKNAKA